jgi:hypothetical protein
MMCPKMWLVFCVVRCWSCEGSGSCGALPCLICVGRGEVVP